MEQSLFARTDRTAYGTEAEISAASATADLRRLVDAGLLTQHGRGRNVHYRASDALRERVAAG
jgi:DNA-binding transcriptional regulator PaaX